MAVELAPHNISKQVNASSDFYYDAPHPHTLWKGVEETPLADDIWEQPDDLDTPSLACERPEPGPGDQRASYVEPS